MPIEPLALVEIDCKPLDPDPIRGFSLYDNRSLVALHYFDYANFALNGFTIVRRDVIRKSKFIPSSDIAYRIYKAPETRCPKGRRLFELALAPRIGDHRVSSHNDLSRADQERCVRDRQT